MGRHKQFMHRLGFFVLTIGLLVSPALQAGSYLPIRSTLAYAQNAGTEPELTKELGQRDLPIDRLLKPDGTLNLGSLGGYSGNLDPTGWRMEEGEGGEPRFVRASEAQPPSSNEAPGDENWDSRFGLPGVSGPVYSIALSGTNVYVGGRFDAVGEIPAHNIAMWDGTSWHPLGSGVLDDVDTTSVNTIAIIGSDVYVGGDFVQAGGVPTNSIAKWDGSQWRPVGGGVLRSDGTAGFVFSIVPSGGDLYIGGGFSQAGDVRANGIARWDGSQWYPLGGGVLYSNGLSGTVDAIAISGSDIYVGGGFAQAGDVPARSIARWDGSQWHALGEGLHLSDSGGYVRTLLVADSGLYAGGHFTNSGDVSLKHVAKWDGVQWMPLGSGTNNGVGGGTVWSLVMIGTDLYVGGFFNRAGANTIHNLARWDGTQWYSLNADLERYGYPTVYDIAPGGNDLYVGGDFTVIGGVTASRIARWDGAQWHNLPSGGDSGAHRYVYAIAVKGSEVYVGGEFTRVGNVPVKGIAMWNGTAWSTTLPGITDSSYRYVKAMAVVGNDVYIGGYFTQVGGVAANNIARWDGSQWHPLVVGSNNGVPTTVSALAVSGNDLYVGGSFTLNVGEAIRGVARWDGSQWHALGSGIDRSVTALAVYGSDLYVGGTLTTAGGVPARNVARWDGSQWHALGEGTNNSVLALATDGNNLYAGGTFTMTGSLVVNRLARWDGSQWDDMGGGVQGCVVYGIERCDINVRAITLAGNDVYVGGQFLTAGSVSALNIARWDGTQWRPLGSGIGNPLGFGVYSMALSGSDLYVGGYFRTAGEKASSHFALWHNICLSSFTDVSPDNTFYPYVRCLACRGILGGYSDGTFRPGNSITRGQLSKIISNAAGFNDPPPGQLFEDVPPGSPFYEWVQRLASRSVIGGYPCGAEGEPCVPPANRPYFRPNGNATRGQISKIVANAVGISDPPGEQRFEDVPPGSPFYIWVQSLAGRAVMGGYPCGGMGEPCAPPNNLPYFRPNSNATRGQLSKITANTFFPNCSP